MQWPTTQLKPQFLGDSFVLVRYTICVLQNKSLKIQKNNFLQFLKSEWYFIKMRRTSAISHQHIIQVISCKLLKLFCRLKSVKDVLFVHYLKEPVSLKNAALLQTLMLWITEIHTLWNNSELKYDETRQHLHNHATCNFHKEHSVFPTRFSQRSYYCKNS